MLSRSSVACDTCSTLIFAHLGVRKYCILLSLLLGLFFLHFVLQNELVFREQFIFCDDYQIKINTTRIFINRILNNQNNRFIPIFKMYCYIKLNILNLVYFINFVIKIYNRTMGNNEFMVMLFCKTNCYFRNLLVMK